MRDGWAARCNDFRVSDCSALSNQPELLRETIVQHTVQDTAQVYAQHSLLSWCPTKCEEREWQKTENWVLEAHLSWPWALAHNDFLICSYFWWIVVYIQHLDGNGDATEEAGVVWSREKTNIRRRRAVILNEDTVLFTSDWVLSLKAQRDSVLRKHFCGLKHIWSHLGAAVSCPSWCAGLRCSIFPLPRISM